MIESVEERRSGGEGGREGGKGGGRGGRGGKEKNSLLGINLSFTAGSPVLRSRTGSGVEKWRVTALAKLTENRYNTCTS